MKRGIAFFLSLLLLACLPAEAFAADTQWIVLPSEEGNNREPPTVFYQSDERWADQIYYYSDPEEEEEPPTIASAGCGLLAFVNAVYYLNGTFIDPVFLGNYAAMHDYHTDDGTLWGLYESFAEEYGAECGFVYAGESYGFWDLRNKLLDGCVAICSVPGHIMAIVDFDLKTGRYLLMDSNPHWRRGTGNGWSYKTRDELEAIPSLTTKDVGITPQFMVFRAAGTLRVNCVSDTLESGDACGTFDVWIGGEQVADDVSTFMGLYPYGTQYAITDVQALGENQICDMDEADLRGDIQSFNVNLRLLFHEDPSAA